MLELKELAEKLVNLNIKQINELSEILKNTHNIEPIIATGVISEENKDKEANEDKKEKKTHFDVILTSMGKSKLPVVKIVKEFTELGLKESKDLVESAPKTIKEKVNEKEAKLIKEKLENVGASVELK